MKLGRHDIHLWLVRDRDVQDPALLLAYQGLLSAEEQAISQRIVQPAQRHQYLVTRALVRTVLSRYDGHSAPNMLSFISNGYGTPSLARRGTQGDVSFNLSHSEALVVLAVGLDRMIGVDVECMSRPTDFIGLSERYFAPQEARWLQGRSTRELSDGFFELWTLKEAYVKARGLGLSLSLDAFGFQFAGQGISVSFSSACDDHPANWRFWQFRPTPAHTLALAVAGPELNDLVLSCYEGVPMTGFRPVRHQASRFSS